MTRPGRARRAVAQAARVAPDIIRRLEHVDPSVADWAIQGASSTEAGIVALILGSPGHAPSAVLKLALTPAAERSLARERTAVAALEADERLGDWRDLLPCVLAAGRLQEGSFLLEHALRGRNAVSLLGMTPARPRLQTVAAETVRTLHERTGVSTSVSVARVDRWLAEPLGRVCRAAGVLRGARGGQAMSRLAADIRASLIGRRLRVSSIHGDFWLGNLLVAGGGAEVTGIVDWDFAGNDELPVLDLLHLVIYTRVLVERKELGRVVRELLDGGVWTRHELSLLQESDAELARDLEYARATLLLYWLRHLGSNLAQSNRYLVSRPWLGRNLDPVLRLFERPSRAGQR